MNNDHSKKPEPRETLIKSHLQRAFEDRASEDLPNDLMALIEQLKSQDNQNGTS